MLDLAVLDDFQIADRLAGGERQADFQLQLRARFGLKHVAGQLAFDRGLQQRAVGDEHLPGAKLLATTSRRSTRRRRGRRPGCSRPGWATRPSRCRPWAESAGRSPTG